MGIVKKNAIMMIDFALEAERGEGLSPRDAIVKACILRFRPIMMTTLAALFGAIPLAVEGGTGSELRNPLGVTIIGGLLLSQLLTLYTTPVIYLQMERLRARIFRRASGARSSRSSICRCGRNPRSGRRSERMNICEPAIRRPIGTTLLAIGLLLVGRGGLPVPAGRQHADRRIPDHQRVPPAGRAPIPRPWPRPSPRRSSVGSAKFRASST